MILIESGFFCDLNPSKKAMNFASGWFMQARLE